MTREESVKVNKARGVRNVIKVLQAGDITELSENGYHLLCLLPDFIAHNERAKFMQYYADIRDLMEDLEYALPERERIARRDNDKEELKLLQELSSFIKKTDFTKQVQAAKEKNIKHLEMQIAALQELIEQDKSGKRITKRTQRMNATVKEELAYQQQQAEWERRVAERKERRRLRS